MIKNIIIVASLAAGMFACASKGQHTCTCDKAESSYTNGSGSTTTSTSSDIGTIVYTDLTKSEAETACSLMNIKVTSDDVDSKTGALNPPKSSSKTVFCKLTD